MVTDFSAKNKASGVKLCTAVHRRARQGISHFCELCLPQKPKIGRIGKRTTTSTQRPRRVKKWGSKLELLTKSGGQTPHMDRILENMGVN